MKKASFKGLLWSLGGRKIAYLLRYRRFLNEFRRFKQQAASTEGRFTLLWKDRYPVLGENTSTTKFDRHYVFHLAWAARVLAETKPKEHVDIASSLYFCTLVSAFVPIRFYDLRPAELGLPGLESRKGDLLSLPFADQSVPSISCMHVVEHVGLGRYGDRLDPDGDLKAIAELRRVVAVGGTMLFVVPVGKPRVMFNAHRVYSYAQINSYFEEFELKECALIPDDPKDGGLVYNATNEMADAQAYGCGCFWFVRKMQ